MTAQRHDEAPSTLRAPDVLSHRRSQEETKARTGTAEMAAISPLAAGIGRDRTTIGKRSGSQTIPQSSVVIAGPEGTCLA
jgi:hypothetical protein